MDIILSDVDLLVFNSICPKILSKNAISADSSEDDFFLSEDLTSVLLLVVLLPFKGVNWWGNLLSNYILLR